MPAFNTIDLGLQSQRSIGIRVANSEVQSHPRVGQGNGVTGAIACWLLLSLARTKGKGKGTGKGKACVAPCLSSAAHRACEIGVPTKRVGVFSKHTQRPLLA